MSAKECAVVPCLVRRRNSNSVAGLKHEKPIYVLAGLVVNGVFVSGKRENVFIRGI